MGHNTGSRFDVRQIMYFIEANAKCSIFSYFAVHWVLSFVKIKFDDAWNWCGWITLLVHKCQDVSTPGAFGDDDWIFEKNYLSNTFQRKILYHVLTIAHRLQWNLNTLKRTFSIEKLTMSFKLQCSAEHHLLEDTFLLWIFELKVEFQNLINIK